MDEEKKEGEEEMVNEPLESTPNEEVEEAQEPLAAPEVF